jgi:hypothetical protein
MTGFVAEFRCRYLSRCGIFCASRARSEKPSLPVWAYFVEKLVAASANF